MKGDEQNSDWLFEIFNQAGALPPGHARDRLLDETCGDDTVLREQVTGLLAASERAGKFLTPGGLFDGSRGITEKTGDHIGPYLLLEKLGEGGCGVVYRARQEGALRREVALKIIKLGMDTESVVARFEAERQALALMEHHNIAQVFAAGATDTGRPYFAMELVNGMRITEYCVQRELPVIERLRLFVRVCHAVQHAHQKGVIHRDLKPANILVTEEDGLPTPKVIDFGIAKAIGPQLAERTILTAFEQFVGTPAYMSPEQMAASSTDVDTRSDIYSLGVLLHELLTGCTPFDQKEMLTAGLDEMRRIIREVEPARPSARILKKITHLMPASVDSAQTTDSMPGLKDTVHRLRGDLDWVILKCLEKDRERRYATATGLANDIERHLNNEPVLATPPSLGYRIRKLTLRHKSAMVAGLLVALALVAGLISTTWGMVRAHRAEAAAAASERERGKQLSESLVAQARATRVLGQPGRRFQSLELLSRARRISRELGIPDDGLRDLRNAVTASLTVSDLHWTDLRVTLPEDVYDINFDESHSRCAMTNWTGECSIRSADGDRELFHLSGHGTPATARLNPDGNLAALLQLTKVPSDSLGLELWDLRAAAPRLVFAEPNVYESSFRRSDLLAVSYLDGALGVFNLRDEKWEHRLPPGRQTKEVRIALHPANPLIAVSSYYGNMGTNENEVTIVDYRKGAVVQRLPQDARVSRVEWTPDGETLAVGYGEKKKVGFYRRSTWERELEIETQQAVTAIAFTRDGRGMAVNGWTNTVELFHAGLQQRFMTASRPQNVPCFSSDGSRLASAFHDGNLGLLNVALPAEMRQLVRTHAPESLVCHQFSIHPDGRLLVVAMSDGIGFWDLWTGREAGFIPGEHMLNRVLFQPDGSLLTGGQHGISRWKFARKPDDPGSLWLSLPERLPLPIADSISQSRDGGVIATVGRSVVPRGSHAGAWVWRAEQPKNPLRIDPGGDYIFTALSPDGKRFVTITHFGGIVKLWNAESGAFVKQLAGSNFGVPRFSDDGRWFFTVGTGGRLISTETWEPVRNLDCRHVVPAPGSRMAAVSTDDGIRLIDLATFGEIAFLERSGPNALNQMEFSPDGTQLVVLHAAHDLEIWDLRLIREGLKALDLDWSWPAFPPASEVNASPFDPIRVRLLDSESRH